MSASSLSASVVRRLRQLRASAGVSVPQLAKSVGLTTFALNRIEDGRTQPTVETLNDVAAELGASLASIVREAQLTLTATPPRESSAPVPSLPAAIGRAIVELPGGDKLALAEAAAIRHALGVTDGNVSAAARLVGLDRQSFTRRLRRLK